MRIDEIALITVACLLCMPAVGSNKSHQRNKQLGKNGRIRHGHHHHSASSATPCPPKGACGDAYGFRSGAGAMPPLKCAAAAGVNYAVIDESSWMSVLCTSTGTPPCIDITWGGTTVRNVPVVSKEMLIGNDGVKALKVSHEVWAQLKAAPADVQLNGGTFTAPAMCK